MVTKIVPFWQCKLSVIILLNLLAVSCHQKAISLQQNQKSKLGSHSANFLAKLDIATSIENERDYLLTQLAKFKIEPTGEKLNILSNFSVTKDGKFLVVDSITGRVLLYSHTGEYIRDIGSHGNGKDKYLFPTGAVGNNIGELSVVDFSNKRVLVYSDQGELRNTFTYTQENFSATGIRFDPADNSYLLTGNRWTMNQEKKVTGAKMVHRYNISGENLSSSLNFPEWAKPLDLYVYDTPLVDVCESKIYAMLPFEYKISVIDASSRHEENLAYSSEKFRRPTTKLEVDPKKPDQAAQLFDDWMLSWTPVRNLTVLNNYIVVQYQEFSPLRYHVDIWKIGNDQKVLSFSTNRALLSHDEQGNIFFLENKDERINGNATLLKIKLDDLLNSKLLN